MKLTSYLSNSIKTCHFGGNWTDVNLKNVLSDISAKEAHTRIGQLNTILALTFHINYFIEINLRVFQGGPLEGNDKYSFDHPPINTDKDWHSMVENSLKNAALYSDLIKDLPEEKLWEIFCDEKYGNYYDNIQGIIEHSHYHLGQIAVIKKLIREGV